jgi:hypothetical protein
VLDIKALFSDCVVEAHQITSAYLGYLTQQAETGPKTGSQKPNSGPDGEAEKVTIKYNHFEKYINEDLGIWLAVNIKNNWDFQSTLRKPYGLILPRILSVWEDLSFNRKGVPTLKNSNYVYINSNVKQGLIVLHYAIRKYIDSNLDDLLGKTTQERIHNVIQDIKFRVVNLDRWVIEDFLFPGMWKACIKA